jgi:hypothetical protein
MEKTALETQIGGSHYKKFEYQPIEFFMDNNFNAALTYAMKYVSRYPNKNPDNLDKALHCIDLFYEWTYAKLKANDTYPVIIPFFDEIYRFTSQFEPVISNALLSIVACNTDYFRTIPLEDRNGLKEQVSDFSQLQSNVTKAKAAIEQVRQYYETRT